MRCARHGAIIAVAATMLARSAAAVAGDDPICREIAGVANNRASQVEEAEPGAVAEAVTKYLPPGVTYPSIKPIRSADLFALLGCDSAVSCAGKLLPDWMFKVASDDQWLLGWVDARDWSNKVVVLAKNSFGCHLVAVLTPDAKGRWQQLPFAPNGAKEECLGSVVVLRSGTVPYLATLNFTSSFKDNATSVELNLGVYDPGAASSPDMQASKPQCSVMYAITTRLVVDRTERGSAWSDKEDGAVRDLLDRKATSMLETTRFNERQGTKVTIRDDFVADGISEETLAPVQQLLRAHVEDDDLTKVAMQIFEQEHVAAYSPDAHLGDLEGEWRWLPVGTAGSAYAALLGEYSEFEMPVDRWRNFVAMFQVDGGELKLFAVYVLKETARFQRAAASPGTP